MKFTKKEDQYYPKYYYESEDGEFAIGVENMLFSRTRIQVLHRDKGGHLWGIEEYPTYVRELELPLIFDIMANLENVNPKNGREWWLVFEALPPRHKKYLEDSKKDEDYVRRHASMMENVKRLKSKYNTI